MAAENEQLLYNAALKYTGNRFDAEDLFQESMYAAHKNFHQLRDEQKFRSWLFTIFRNIYLKNQRHKNRLLSAGSDIDAVYLKYLDTASRTFDLEKIYEHKVESERIQELISGLPEKYKSVLVLYFMEDLSYKEISDVLDVPIGTVMSRLSRGKTMLKKDILRLQIKQKTSDKIIPLNLTGR